MSFTLRSVTDSDRPFLRAFMREHWGDEMMFDRDRLYYPAEQSGFLAEEAGQVIGVITYQFENGQCEVTSLESLRRDQGVGGALLKAAIAESQKAGHRRVWLVTTNDNINALRFYQKRGFHIVAVYPDAVTVGRQKYKPSIPVTGESGIPIRDELELELIL